MHGDRPAGGAKGLGEGAPNPATGPGDQYRAMGNVGFGHVTRSLWSGSLGRFPSGPSRALSQDPFGGFAR